MTRFVGLDRHERKPEVAFLDAAGAACGRRISWSAAWFCAAMSFAPIPGRAEKLGGDVSASVPEAGAQALGGALAGATVEPSSGVLRSSLPIMLPSARGSSQPSLGLSYSSAAGVREAGVGWGLNLPVVERSTRLGPPRLDDDLVKSNPRVISVEPVRYEQPNPDELLFNGERLVPICEVASAKTPCSLAAEPLPGWLGPGWRYYRLEIDSHARFFWSPSRATWRVQLRGGEILELGQPMTVSLLDHGSVPDPDASVDYDEIMKLVPQQSVRHTVVERRAPFRWNLVRRFSPSPAGGLPNNLIVYQWEKLGSTGRGYLTDVYYSPAVAAWPSPPDIPLLTRPAAIATTSFAHHVNLRWSFIPQAGNLYTPVWRATPDWTLSGIDVASKPEPAAPREMVRRYHLKYRGNQRAYLLSYQMEGRCDAATFEVDELLPVTTGCPRRPATTLRWSAPEPSTGPVAIEGTPPFPSPAPEGWQLIPLDINADGLPDLVENNAGFSPNTSQPSSSYGAFEPAQRRVYIADDAGFKELKLDGPAALLSRFGTSLTGDFSGTGATGAVLYFPTIARDCGIAPGSPCGQPYALMGGRAFGVVRLANTAGAVSYLWEPGRTHVFSLGQLHEFTIEAVGDVNGDGVPDVLDAHTAPGELFDDPVAAIHVSFGGRGGTAYEGRTTSCVGPSMEEMRTFHWGDGAWLPETSSYAPLPVALADMNGDGLADLVLVGPGAIKYWPGDGRGNFSACRGAGCTCSENGVYAPGVPMIIPAAGLPTSAKGWRLADLNGDGYADLIAVADDGIRVFLNVDGFLLAEPIFFAGPALFPAEWQTVVNNVEALKISFADMNGNGLTDLVLQVGSRVLTLDLQRGPEALPLATDAYAPRPGLLIEINNGLGAKTEIAYETTAELARSAIVSGAPWREPMPQVMQVVGRITTRTEVPGDPPVRVVYRYDGPAWDGYERRFRGFREVTMTRLSSPSVSTRTTYLIPPCPQGFGCGAKDPDQAAASGAPLITETFDDQDRYLTTVSRSYDVKEAMRGYNGAPIRFAYLSRMDTRVYDINNRQPAAERGSAEITRGGREPILKVPVPIRSGANALLRTTWTVDEFGSTLDTVDYGRIKNDGGQVDDPIHSATHFLPPRPDWKFLADSSTVDPFQARPLVPADHARKKSFTYDAAGRLKEVKAYLTGTRPLDRRHEDGKPIAPPPPAAAGNNTWISLAHYEYDQFDNLVEDRGPSGRCTAVAYDKEFAQLPAEVVRYRSGCGSHGTAFNSVPTRHRWDRGFEAPTESTAQNGTVSRVAYDGFGRQRAIWLPDPGTGQTQPEPWVTFSYHDVPGGPVQRARMEVRDAPGRSRSTWTYTDGAGREILTLTQADPAAGDGGAWVGTGLSRLDGSGLVSGSYAPWFYNGNPANHPLTPPATAMSGVVRDSFGRIVESRRPDGSLARRTVYRPLSMETEDAAGRWTEVAVDGHGRIVQALAPGQAGGGPTVAADILTVETAYQVGGEIARVVQSNSRSAAPMVRWLEHDSLGRMVLNAEPNTASGFDPDPALATSMHAWRYAYDDAGDLVGTSDARGCGENFHYDNLGRLLAEDYSPCLSAHGPYTPLTNISFGVGAEAFYRYDAPEPGQTDGFGVKPANLNGRLVAILDRATHNRYAYDWRGRQVGISRRLTRPSDPDGVWPEGVPAPGDRYATHWHHRSTEYDNSDRVVSATTGAESAELTGFEGISQLDLTYSARGLTVGVAGTYGPLLENVGYGADGKLATIRHGDAAHTLATFTYDQNGRPEKNEVYRRPPALWTDGAPGYTPPAAGEPPTTQRLLVKSVYSYDAAGLLAGVQDARAPAEWPAGARPVGLAYGYDQRARVVRTDYQRAAPDPPLTSSGPGPGVPAAVLPDRIAFQTFGFDARGNLAAVDDDSGARYDRSLGSSFHGGINVGPNQLRSSVDGAISADYDAAGNMTNLVVRRPGPCADGEGRCTHRFVFDWDEVGRLARARRWDYAAIPADEPVYPAIPTASPEAELRYRYDSGGLRVLSSTVKADGSQLHTADLFETLELVGAGFDDLSGVYEQTGATEIVLLPGIGQVVYRPGLPRLGDSDRHTLLKFVDHLGSTTAMVDHATGELVQRTTYQAFGSVESDYLPPRWGGLASREGFSGKPQDAEVRLTYFGARYYQPALGRWISADPLTVHGLGADGNPYAYVGDQPSMATDPMGLEPSCTGACLAARQQGFDVNPAYEVTTPIEIQGVPPGVPVQGVPEVSIGEASAYARRSRGPQTWTGAMRVLVNINPIVLGVAMYADPERTLRTTVIPRLEIVESLLGAPNTTSDLADPAARAAGSAGQPALTDTDQLLSITEQEVEGAFLGAAAGRVFRGASALEVRGITAEPCPGGLCLKEFECFLAGTPVMTPDGLRPIEAIRPGDPVLSRNYDNGEISVQSVLRTFVTHQRAVVEIRLAAGPDEERIEATSTHPFYVIGRGWLLAGELQAGMSVSTATGEARVRSVEPIEGLHTVYNFEVESTHTYFVGGLGSWVHNGCPTVFADKVAPGPFAAPNGWIPLRGPGRRWWSVEIQANNVNGNLYGCHSCGTYQPGTLSGNWVIDHQYPVGLSSGGGPFRGYPQCASCGLIRAGGTSQPFQILRILKR